MTAPNPSFRELKRVGRPLEETPRLKDQVGLLLEFIHHGNRVTEPGSQGAELLARMATQFGSVQPDWGQVLAVRVGLRTRMSERVRTPDGEVWIPSATHTRGIVLCDRITPVDEGVATLHSAQALDMKFRTVSLDVVRIDPDSPTGFNPTPARVHLASTALGGIKTLCIEELPTHADLIHTLSKPATDDRQAEYAAAA
jgi:hypothetical protein